VYGQNFAPIGLHKTDTAFDWLLIKKNTALAEQRRQRPIYAQVGDHLLLPCVRYTSGINNAKKASASLG
jgi:hypothetical protein